MGDSASWMNLVEVWFRSVKDLNAKIRAFIDNWNDDQAHPFIWTKTANQILAKAIRQSTSNSDH